MADEQPYIPDIRTAGGPAMDAWAAKRLPREPDDQDGEVGVCGRCGGDGVIEYNDGDPSDWVEDCPSEINHLIECRECNGTGRI